MSYEITAKDKIVEVETGLTQTTESHEFKDWDEVNEFISELQIAAEKVWGPDYSNPAYDI